MKTENKKAVIVSIAVVLVLLLAGVLTVILSDVTVSFGRCVVADSGSVLWISSSGEPVSMHSVNGNKSIFDGLTTGDEILVLRRGAVAESYPGQVGVYACIKLSDGLESDIPEKTLSSLRELGWID